MSRKIQIKRGFKSDIPVLNQGEFGLTTDEQNVYIGTSGGNQLIGGKGVTDQLTNMANYRQETNPTSPNMIAGYSGNNVSSDIYATTIAGGGSSGRENIIGGSTTNVGTTTPNVANLTGSGANFAVIGGGYDNVNNGLACILTGMHCAIEQVANHGTISGGSFHKIPSGAYGTISGGTYNTTSADNASIGGGTHNTASGISSFVGGGDTNQATGLQSSSVGGNQNIASGQSSFVGGGTLNQATNNYTTVSGGSQNQANGDSSTVSGGYKNIITSGTGSSINGGSQNTINGNYATINGGYSNTANGSGSGVTGGHTNTANNIDTAILGGNNNTTNADYSAVLAGQNNNATGKYSTVQGVEGKSYYAGQKVQGGGKFLNNGDAQVSRAVVKGKTTDATTTNLLLVDNTAPTLQTNSSVAFTVTVVARRTDVVGEDKYFEIKGLANRNGASSVVITSGTPVTFGSPTWTVSLLGGSGTFNVRATGEASKTIQWVARIEVVENVG